MAPFLSLIKFGITFYFVIIGLIKNQRTDYNNSVLFITKYDKKRIYKIIFINFPDINIVVWIYFIFDIYLDNEYLKFQEKV